jgi:hypothetical protein
MLPICMETGHEGSWERERETKRMYAQHELPLFKPPPPLPGTGICNFVFMTVFCYFDFHPLYSTAGWVRVIYWSIDGSCYVQF